MLVTGGAGFVGSHACKALAGAGYTPVTYDNLVHGHETAVRWGPLEVGDILDGAKLAAVLARYRPIAVLHFAAFAYVGESMTNPVKYYRNNVAGSVTLFEAALQHGIRRVVFSSSCATFGIPRGGPIAEDHAQVPVNPYGRTKLVVEQLLSDLDYAHGLRSIVLRYFNAAGADPDGQLGEMHLPETHLIPLVLDVAAGRRRSIPVFGVDHGTPDGSCIRDYVHVSDLATAHVQAVERLLAGEGSAAFNLGTGRGASVMEVIEAARRVTGRDIPIEIAPARPGDPPALIAASDQARVALGWRPQWAALEAQIEHAWRWVESRQSRTVTPVCTSTT